MGVQLQAPSAGRFLHLPGRSDVLCLLSPAARGHPGPDVWQRLPELLCSGSAFCWGWLSAEVDSSADIGAFSALQGACVQYKIFLLAEVADNMENVKVLLKRPDNSLIQQGHHFPRQILDYLIISQGNSQLVLCPSKHQDEQTGGRHPD